METDQQVALDDILCRLFTRRAHLIDRKNAVALPCANSVCSECVEKALFKMADKPAASDRRIAFLCPICKGIHCNDYKSLTSNSSEIERIYANHLPSLSGLLDQRLKACLSGKFACSPIFTKA